MKSEMTRGRMLSWHTSCANTDFSVSTTASKGIKQDHVRRSDLTTAAFDKPCFTSLIVVLGRYSCAAFARCSAHAMHVRASRDVVVLCRYASAEL